MFAGSAVGEFLPPMVVYKTDNVYQNWVKNGPVGSIYDATQSGWFDMRTFDLWFPSNSYQWLHRCQEEKY